MKRLMTLVLLWTALTATAGERTVQNDATAGERAEGGVVLD